MASCCFERSVSTVQSALLLGHPLRVWKSSIPPALCSKSLGNKIKVCSRRWLRYCWAHSGIQRRRRCAQSAATAALSPSQEPAATVTPPDVIKEEESSLLRQLLCSYNSALTAHPVRTKAFTSFLGFALGDYLAQGIAGDGIFDALRCLRLSLYGLLIDGPAGHWWYRVLDSRVVPESPTSTRAVLLKTAADQVLWAPVMTCVFFAFLKLLEGHPEQVFPTIQNMLVRTVVANYVLWPLAHYLNFKFVPSEHRVLYNNVVSVAWNAYLSWSCGGVDPAQSSPQLSAAEPTVDDWWTAVPCAHKVTHTPEGLSAMHVLSEARQLVGMERVLNSWGLQGFADASTSSELWSHYIQTKMHVMQQVCNIPVHTPPPKF